MFNSLPQFYNSNEWKAFRKQLIADRTNKVDGILYDEISNKPLVKAYDIVAHHKIPLTINNVNDYMISLNPDNVILIGHDTHNQEHNRFGYLAERKVYYVYGAPCSGKTTFVNSIKGNSDLVVDMDSIWQCISGSRYDKPKALNTIAFGVRDLLLDMVKTRAGKWEKAFIIDGGARYTDRTRKIELYGAESIFMDTDISECKNRLYANLERNKSEVEKWERYIDEWFESYTES